MKYIVSRSSSWFGKPIPQARKGEVHPFCNLVAGALPYRVSKVREMCHNFHRKDDGTWFGIYNEPTDVWFCDIDDLHKFAEQYGRIILSPPENEEGIWKIEIYDDFRE